MLNANLGSFLSCGSVWCWSLKISIKSRVQERWGLKRRRGRKAAQGREGAQNKSSTSTSRSLWCLNYTRLVSLRISSVPHLDTGTLPEPGSEPFTALQGCWRCCSHSEPVVWGQTWLGRRDTHGTAKPLLWRGWLKKARGGSAPAEQQELGTAENPSSHPPCWLPQAPQRGGPH